MLCFPSKVYKSGAVAVSNFASSLLSKDNSESDFDFISVLEHKYSHKVPANTKENLTNLEVGIEVSWCCPVVSSIGSALLVYLAEIEYPFSTEILNL